jgi:UDP-N-acetylmuramyl pentapeptide phosphotransferase/UDP-N-acetylglucosamine-1-phosphate transferase
VCLAASYSHLNQDLLLSPSEMRSRHIGLAVTLIGVWAAGRWVDRKGHAHLWNIVALTAGALILAGSGFLIHTIRIGSSVHDLGWVSVPATVLWLVIISEMFRLFDGLDGILVLLVMAAIAVQLLFVLPEEEGYARALCGSALPALAGLLPWRIYPARMELRGIGAFLPGFVFGAITLVGREKAFTTKAVVLPTLAAIIVFSLFCLWLLEQHLFLPKQKK